MKRILVSTVAVLALTTTAINAEGLEDISISANMAVTSNYLWRGMTQTDDGPAFQGGIDLEYNGFYLGTWGSNVSWVHEDESSLEMDLYVGYSGVLEGLGYDIGYIKYTYPKATSSNEFDEVYLGLSYDFEMVALSATYSKGLDDAADDIAVGASIPLPGDIGLELEYGDYDTVGSRVSASVGKTFGKFDVSLAYVDFSADSGSDGDEDNVVLTVGTSF